MVKGKYFAGAEALVDRLEEVAQSLVAALEQYARLVQMQVDLVQTQVRVLEAQATITEIAAEKAAE